MKARVKLTGQIVDVVVKEIPQYGIQGENSGGPIKYLITRFYDGENYYRYDELDFDVESFDYWTRLEHQYAGMAMQALLSSDTMLEVLSRRNNGTMEEEVAREAFDYAHALVEKLKEKETK